MTVPLPRPRIEPLAGDRAVLDVSLAGYVAAVLALFWLLLLRFRLAIAAAVTLGHGLPARRSPTTRAIRSPTAGGSR